MFELPFIFLGGLLGSSHCLGMCGGFAVLIGLHSKNRSEAMLSQGLYTTGRLFTYSIIGAVAGFLGSRINFETRYWGNASAVLCIFAGIFLIAQGMKSAGWTLWNRKVAPHSQGCLTGSMFREIIRGRSMLSRFLAGVFTGFLPCGLLYAFIALAAATRDLAWGAAIMAIFGLGTAPMMILTGLGGSMLSVALRERVLKVAAWSVVLTGLLTTYRGIGFLSHKPESGTAACPFCTSAVESVGKDTGS